MYNYIKVISLNVFPSVICQCSHMPECVISLKIYLLRDGFKFLKSLKKRYLITNRNFLFILHLNSVPVIMHTQGGLTFKGFQNVILKVSAFSAAQTNTIT